jgi:hypothetical protein
VAGFHTAELFFTDDSGLWFFPTRDAGALVDPATEQVTPELMVERHRGRLRKLSDERLFLPAAEPYLEGHDTWCVNVPGSLLEGFFLEIYTARAHNDGTVAQFIQEVLAFPHKQTTQDLQAYLDAFVEAHQPFQEVLRSVERPRPRLLARGRGAGLKSTGQRHSRGCWTSFRGVDLVVSGRVELVRSSRADRGKHRRACLAACGASLHRQPAQLVEHLPRRRTSGAGHHRLLAVARAIWERGQSRPACDSGR